MSIVGLPGLPTFRSTATDDVLEGKTLRTVLFINSMRQGLPVVSGQTLQAVLATDGVAMLTKSACTDLPSALMRSGLGAS
jgi:hypothetical protein